MDPAGHRSFRTTYRVTHGLPADQRAAADAGAPTYAGVRAGDASPAPTDPAVNLG